MRMAPLLETLLIMRELIIVTAAGDRIIMLAPSSVVITLLSKRESEIMTLGVVNKQAEEVKEEKLQLRMERERIRRSFGGNGMFSTIKNAIFNKIIRGTGLESEGRVT